MNKSKFPHAVAVSVITLLWLAPCPHALQDLPQQDLSHLHEVISSFKKDPKGPFSKIQWYCPDGTVIPAQARCKHPGGIQHASLKPLVSAWHRGYHLFVGQILAGTKYENFLDSAYAFSRMKQYQIEKYLQKSDDGWVLRKAQYYRGAYQIEDEEKWAKQFLFWLFSYDEFVKRHYFLARQLVLHLPLSSNTNLLEKIRIESKVISEKYPEFMDMRIKLHAHPDSSDIKRVQDFMEGRKGKNADMDSRLSGLIKNLKAYYQHDPVKMLKMHNQTIKNTALTSLLTDIIEWNKGRSGLEYIKKLSGLLWAARKEVLVLKNGQERLDLISLSVNLEQLLAGTAVGFKPARLGDWIHLNASLSFALAGCGFLEMWEWEHISPRFTIPGKSLTGEALQDLAYLSRRTVEWSVAMVNACYWNEVDMFSRFEPLARYFIDEKVRSSLLFAAGAANEGLSQAAMDRLITKDASTHLLKGARGLNPGIAKGTMELIDNPKLDLKVKKDGIYVFPRAPQDLKPVAGILSVSEGNPISHIQLLARNLGIPNAVITRETFETLRKMQGTTVFLSVTPRASVWLKPVEEITGEEELMIAKQERNKKKITISTKKLDLNHLELDKLMDLRSKHSGRICGPKAAHLGELRHMFPDKVAPGFIIPFGVFRSHLDQKIPGKEISYWQLLRKTYAKALVMREGGVDEEKIENAVLNQLNGIRKEIERIFLKPEFEKSLLKQFREVFEAPIGNTAVFIRSDTNMEDLKEFTGAGLNLTVPNVKTKEDILKAIKAVWASPFTERSYLWRQKYLNNALDVYPSILILKSVNSEKSGVLITKDFVTDDEKSMTVTFSRGVGGAVAGQSGESYIISRKGEPLLLSPTRDPDYVRLPDEGGLMKKAASFENPILDKKEIRGLYEIGIQLRKKLYKSGMRGPYDIELGIADDKIWLFQARPLAESKGSRKFAYLHSLDDKLPVKKTISITEE